MASAAVIGLAGLVACAEKPPHRTISGADPKQGLALIESQGCGACHQIPGVAWPRGEVGGSLAGFADRALIAGRHPNQPEVLVRWLRDPPALSPDTAMPATTLTDAQARDVAAYLLTLHDD
ncbi:c-type cytochrome [Caulobacter sp.]|uniref:c-type cytochrome n=1 Tax=Caulobacter sp. TaxID=78 RepID=UPI001B1C2EB3|nr:c-type cytochrome [Caulobacter sp.]MBO9544623.1 c-type cytochrome [Caulobacter sp.]